MEQETEKILEKLRTKRTEMKRSMLRLATDAGISHSHLYYIESKQVVPSIDVVIKIAKSLDLTLKDFLD
ncbi:hypothetical protein FACS1894200_05590 [Spirochaetia bacterium]|nr:hypothetical protein FACS1894200_05590 [Spirochaetia bacterium]